MDCYFSSEILVSNKLELLQSLLSDLGLPFNSAGSLSESGKFTIDGLFSGEIVRASIAMQTFSDGLKANGFQHVIWLDDEDSILYKTYTFNWPYDDYT